MNDQPVNRGSIVAGVFFILVGVAFLLQELGLWDLKAVYIFPVLLIALGVAVILGGTRRRESS
ncbi:MAG: LiaI-LiaF-like domain-containing protein [Acidimicrobiia bacterium]